MKYKLFLVNKSDSTWWPDRENELIDKHDSLIAAIKDCYEFYSEIKIYNNSDDLVWTKPLIIEADDNEL